MSTVEREITLENTSVFRTADVKSWMPSTAYRCHICTVREDDGTFSAIVLNLPGCGSCGDTEEEAIANVREAILGVIESHVEAMEEIPWQGSLTSKIPDGARQKWIIVNA